MLPFSVTVSNRRREQVFQQIVRHIVVGGAAALRLRSSAIDGADRQGLMKGHVRGLALAIFGGQDSASVYCAQGTLSTDLDIVRAFHSSMYAGKSGATASV